MDLDKHSTQPEDDRLLRRRSFDEVAALYDRARPLYPEAAVDELVSFSGLGPHSRVLEIGCGTGQLTIPLAERGASILAVELGPNLAMLATRKLARFPLIRVVVADFDSWSIPESGFDVVVAATAFHWLNPSTRVTKCVSALRPGGILAIVERHWSAGSGSDRFFTESQACYARWDPHHVPGFQAVTLSSLPLRNEELEASGKFNEIGLRQFVQERNYSAAEYCELLGTFSDIRTIEETARSGFLACMRQLIDSRFDGSIVRKDVYRIWLARRDGNAEI